MASMKTHENNTTFEMPLSALLTQESDVKRLIAYNCVYENHKQIKYIYV